jgi:hypothetical protein
MASPAIFVDASIALVTVYERVCRDKLALVTAGAMPEAVEWVFRSHHTICFANLTVIISKRDGALLTLRGRGLKMLTLLTSNICKNKVVRKGVCMKRTRKKKIFGATSAREFTLWEMGISLR